VDDTRYSACFARLAAVGDGALVPFVMLGDPDPATSDRIIDALVAGGADALELGIPHSDPIADGPVIQAASGRALAGGATPLRCLAQISGIRARHPDLPIGILSYANLVLNHGTERFYQDAAVVGVDSVLLADVPIDEAAPFITAARVAEVAPVLIAPPDAADDVLDRIAEWSAGYVYCVARRGVTGSREQLSDEAFALFDRLKLRDAAPALLGFGISTPVQVGAAIAAGARGAIVGSALVARIADASTMVAVSDFIATLKAATRRDPPAAASPPD
jgi:tryptophan synthase alpha chain